MQRYKFIALFLGCCYNVIFGSESTIVTLCMNKSLFFIGWLH